MSPQSRCGLLLLPEMKRRFLRDSAYVIPAPILSYWNIKFEQIILKNMYVYL